MMSNDIAPTERSVIVDSSRLQKFPGEKTPNRIPDLLSCIELTDLLFEKSEQPVVLSHASLGISYQNNLIIPVFQTAIFSK